MKKKFISRQQAGLQLASSLPAWHRRRDLVVLGLPRGGVPVAFEVARELFAPLDILMVRKLGAPSQPELAIGAIAEPNEQVLNTYLIKELGISQKQIEHITSREQAEIKRRTQLYRGNKKPIKLKGKTVIIVDDGVATGATMQAAISSVRQQLPRAIIVATPVAAQDTLRKLNRLADAVICLSSPASFGSVGAWYQEFPQVSDAEVITLLEMAQDNYKSSKPQLL